jgi:hypothetical protein
MFCSVTGGASQGIPWGKLQEEEPPHVPNPATFPTTADMQDGANDDWLFEGEATPIGGTAHDRDSDELAFAAGDSRRSPGEKGQKRLSYHDSFGIRLTDTCIMIYWYALQMQLSA